MASIPVAVTARADATGNEQAAAHTRRTATHFTPNVTTEG